MSQTVLSFKLEMTTDTLTAHSGLILFGEYLAALKVSSVIDAHLPAAGSGVGFAPSVYIQPLLLMLSGGGQTLADMRVIRSDTGLQQLLKMITVPSQSAFGDWLLRYGENGGLEGLESAQRELNAVALNNESRTDYTLDIDATQIVAHKMLAAYTYKGEKGYMPMVGHIAENGLIIGDDFRSGNVAPATDNLEFIQYCEAQLPAGKTFTAIRADSAAYQAAIFNHCEKNHQFFAIGAPQDSAVKKAILSIPEEHWEPYRDREIAATVHCMEGTDKAFTLVVTRKGQQQELFADEKQSPYFYHAIATNKTGSASVIKDWYCQRAETSENRIKELKLGTGMDRMPCGKEKANALFFRIGVLAYNLSIMFKTDVLPEKWQRYQLKTIRWQLFQVAGKVVSGARYLKLKISEMHLELFGQIRKGIWERKCQLE